MTPMTRDHQFKIMVSEAELTMVKELTEATGLTASDIVRQLIRREHASVVGGSRQAAPKSKRKNK